MKLTHEEVVHIADLARLDLSDMEKEIFSVQLSQILSHIEKLGELDTADVDPTAHVIPSENVFRNDKAEKNLAVYLEDMAPEEERGHFRVPKIIDG